MRAPALIISLVQWRWTPSVVLVAGSLAFVGIVVLIVPDDLGSVASGADRLSRAARQGVPKKLAGTSDESLPPSTDEEPPAVSPQRPAALPPTPRTGPVNNIVQSIFHPTPKVELPVEPVDPNPPPPPPAPAPPPPTATTFTLETPPPAPAEPAPTPAEPQGTTGQGVAAPGQ